MSRDNHLTFLVRVSEAVRGAGNVWDMVMGGVIYCVSGYNITATNLGDGTLTAAGAQNVLNWDPGTGGCSGWNWWGMEMRGGSWSSASGTVRTSDRSKNFSGPWGDCRMTAGFGNSGDVRQSDVGGRGVR